MRIGYWAAIVVTLVHFPAVATDAPKRAASAYTEAEIYTEPHNAAAAAVATQNFIVGRTARDCREAIGKPEEWVKEFANQWQTRNKKYFHASTRYLVNALSYYKRTYGPKAEAAALRAMTDAIRNQGAAGVEEMLAKGDRAQTCQDFLAKVEAGRFDISSDHPLFKEISEIVAVIEAFSAEK